MRKEGATKGNARYQPNMTVSNNKIPHKVHFLKKEFFCKAGCIPNCCWTGVILLFFTVCGGKICTVEAKFTDTISCVRYNATNSTPKIFALFACKAEVVVASQNHTSYASSLLRGKARLQCSRAFWFFFQVSASSATRTSWLA